MRPDLIARLRSATDGAAELHDKRGNVIGYSVHLGNLGDLCDEAAEAIEETNRAQQDAESKARAWRAIAMARGDRERVVLDTLREAGELGGTNHGPVDVRSYSLPRPLTGASGGSNGLD